MNDVYKIKKRINELCSHFTFEYNGVPCGIDPLSIDSFDMWYGEDFFNVKSVDEVMSYPLFGGKSLADITDNIKIIEW